MDIQGDLGFAALPSLQQVNVPVRLVSMTACQPLGAHVLPSLQQVNVPVRLVSMTACQPLGAISDAALVNCPPALFTR